MTDAEKTNEQRKREISEQDYARAYRPVETPSKTDLFARYWTPGQLLTLRMKWWGIGFLCGCLLCLGAYLWRSW